MTHSPHQNTPDPEDYIPSFRRRNLDTSGFMKKLIALVYSQMKNYLTEDIQEKARQAADKLFGS